MDGSGKNPEEMTSAVATEKKKSMFHVSDGRYVLCLTLSALCAILASVSVGSVILLVVSAGLYAFSLTCNNNKIALIFPPICAFVGTYIISGSIADSLYTSIMFPLVGIVIGEMLKMGVGYYKVLAAGAVAIGAMMVTSFGYSVFITYGSLAEGIKTFASQVSEQYISSFNTLYDAYFAETGSTIAITEDMIKTALNEFVKILPGLLCALFATAGALCIGIVKLCTKIFMKMKIVRKPLELSTAVFFLISIVIALIFDSFESTEVVGTTGFNIALIFIVPLCIEGASAIKRRLLMPPYVIVNGRRMKPKGMPKFFLVAILAITAITDIVMLPFFVSLYGAVNVIVREIALATAKKSGR